MTNFVRMLMYRFGKESPKIPRANVVDKQDKREKDKETQMVKLVRSDLDPFPN